MVIADSSTKGKSANDVLQMIQEQTSNLVAETPPEETAEAVETPTEAVEVATETETPKEEQPVEEPTKEETKESLYKIKVDGKEKELTLDQLIAAAQKGDRFETKMAEVKRMEAELEQRKVQVQQPPLPDWKKLDEEFVNKLQESPFRTMMEFVGQAMTAQAENSKAEKRAEREFETSKKELPHFGAVKPLYDGYRDLGYDRDKAWFAAEAEFWRTAVDRLHNDGVKEGEKKAAMKLKAVIPSGEKKGAAQGAVTHEDAKKMTSEQLAKALNLKVVKHPDW